MTGYELRLWRKGLCWTQERAAEELDVSVRTYKMYEKKKQLPVMVQLASQLLTLRFELKEYPTMTLEHILKRLSAISLS
ncbi:XRE family transcriptional regulator [Erwinia psidii]|uniref:helix-turn-helix domain-containing protein n=1 Tax=Erwinia psidii TaxID=69224 RepID=UPI00226B257F|nr:helix-turn-helix transcriptional regulator [Erwinia psidii]MCX8963110.1 XRE family transcriptional regulator [Erwinia psidii]